MPTPNSIGIFYKVSHAQMSRLQLLLQDIMLPCVPYKRDPLEFSNEAHRVKDELANEALTIINKVINGEQGETQ